MAEMTSGVSMPAQPQPQPQPQPPRVTGISYAAVGVSVLAAASEIIAALSVSGEEAARWIEQAPEWVSESLGWGVIFLVLSIPIAISLNIAAGIQGKRNRVAGIIGGVILIAPFLWIAASAIYSGI